MKTYLLLPCLIVFYSFSQSSTYLLDYNGAGAKLTDNGLLFSRDSLGQPGYELPKNSGKYLIYSSGFWIGAIDTQGYLHLAAMRYSGIGQDFFSGPYSTSNSYNDLLYLQKYDQSIWAVTKAEINYHTANYWTPGYIPAPSIANWPGNGDINLGVAAHLAPFVDVNLDSLYNPLDGDYPDIRGDEAAYIIFNDAKSPHTASVGDPLNVEVHLMISQYASTDFLDSTTFINVRVFHRGNEMYTTVKFGLFMDGDIGNQHDDYIGCAPNKDMMYFYNSDNDDENNGYGLNPPAFGVVSLSKPMESCGYFNNSFSYPYSDPQISTHYWYLMNAKWANGNPWTYGGMGFPSSTGGSTTPTNFMFDGNPLVSSEWSEVSSNGNMGDRRGIMTLQSTSLFPNEMSCYDMAIIYSRSGGNNLQNVQSLFETADSVKQFYLDQLTFNCNQVTADIEAVEKGNVMIYPNPSEGVFYIQFTDEIEEYNLNVIDMKGREIPITISNYSTLAKITVEADPGVYLITINEGGQVYTRRIQLIN